MTKDNRKNVKIIKVWDKDEYYLQFYSILYMKYALTEI